MTTMTDSDEQDWYFTFGFAHTHPRTGASLSNCYTVVHGTHDAARARVIGIFGRKWAFQYAAADGPQGAGVERFKLRFIPAVSYSPGELLPPTQVELDCGEWILETVDPSVHDWQKITYHVLQTYSPTVDELRAVMRRYGVPSDAKLDATDGCELMLTWNTRA